MSFETFGLSREILRAITEKGYSIPTEVQQQVIPQIFAGKDILAGSQTGTGKTAGYLLPLLHQLNSRPANRGPRIIKALVVAPTRELAAQIAENVKSYGKYTNLRSSVIYGGVSMKPQIMALRKGIDILVGTPGRLLDHVGQGTLDLSKVDMLVLDEADRMLDMGFIHDIRKIMDLLPRDRQSLLFSATFSGKIKELSQSLLRSPIIIQASQQNSTAEGITQMIYPVDNKRKRELLSHLIETQDWKQVMVFTRTKHAANKLSEQLQDDGIRSAAIHGNKSQSQRAKALADFKQGTVRVLVATDVAARGLDIDQLPFVVNFELPQTPEDYVHRIGRTGRAGRRGEAISLVCIDEHGLLKGIERLLKRPLDKLIIPGYEPDPSIKAEPILRGRIGSGSKRPWTQNRGDQRPRRRGARFA